MSSAQISVIGMHRSGTSMLNRVLGLLGCNLGNVNLENAHWEQTAIKRVNDAALAALGGGWQWVEPELIAQQTELVPQSVLEEIRRIVEVMNISRPWAIKDPRQCLTMPLWHAALTNPAYVWISRHPVEVAMSLRTREAMPLVVGLALWELYVTSALRFFSEARVEPIRLSYDSILQTPVEQLTALASKLEQLGIEMNDTKLESAVEFVSPSLRRERRLDDASEMTPAQQQLWELLQGETWSPVEPSMSSLELLKSYWVSLSAKRRVEQLEEQSRSIAAKLTAKSDVTERLRKELKASKSDAKNARNERDTLVQANMKLQRRGLEQLDQLARVQRAESAELREKVRELEDDVRQRDAALDALGRDLKSERKRVGSLQNALQELAEFAETLAKSSEGVSRASVSLRRELDDLARSSRWKLGNRAGNAMTLATFRGRPETPLDRLNQWQKRLAHDADAVAAITSQFRSSLGNVERVRAPASLAPKEILRRFRKNFARSLHGVESHPLPKFSHAWKVMVGTLSSGENEIERSVRSIAKQNYERVEHRVFEGLKKKEAVATLMEAFNDSDCDFLIKVDADMVLLEPDFVSRVAAVLASNPQVDLFQMAIWDFFTGGPIQGINAYRRGFGWRTQNQNPLFTDRTGISKSRRLVDWSGFVDAVIHCPDPTPFQAFHFGVHRGLKVLQPGEKFDRDRAKEQLSYLESTWEHFQIRRDRRLAFACLGFEMALDGEFSVEELDYSNPRMRSRFSELEGVVTDELEKEILAFRSVRRQSHLQDLIDARVHITKEKNSEVSSIAALIPHVGVFGGVNRFFELRKAFEALGIDFTLVVPSLDNDSENVAGVYEFSRVSKEEWDVALCGDAFHGVMLLLPHLRARLRAGYLLNGWQHRHFYIPQIRAAKLHGLIANSSYSADQYRDLSPTTVAGGVNLAEFAPSHHQPFAGEVVRICAYPGRNKPRKRFDDAVAACRLLQERGVEFELHIYDQEVEELDVPFQIRNHGPLSRAEVAALLSTMDVMLCPEEDAGWSNPAAEAMASGAVVVCTPAGTTDFAIHNESALVVPTRAPTAMADAVERLRREPALAASLRERGLQVIREFDWSLVARRLMDVFNCQLRQGYSEKERSRAQSEVSRLVA